MGCSPSQAVGIAHPVPQVLVMPEKVIQGVGRAAQPLQAPQVERIKDPADVLRSIQNPELQPARARLPHILPDTIVDPVPELEGRVERQDGALAHRDFLEHLSLALAEVREPPDLEIGQALLAPALLDDERQPRQDGAPLGGPGVGREQDPPVFRKRLGDEFPSRDESLVEKRREDRPDPAFFTEQPVVGVQAVDFFDRSLEPGQMDEPAVGMGLDKGVPVGAGRLFPRDPVGLGHRPPGLDQRV